MGKDVISNSQNKFKWQMNVIYEKILNFINGHGNANQSSNEALTSYQ